VKVVVQVVRFVIVLQRLSEDLVKRLSGSVNQSKKFVYSVSRGGAPLAKQFSFSVLLPPSSLLPGILQAAGEAAGKNVEHNARV
jgi:hypothetical protein